MKIAVITLHMHQTQVDASPWNYFKQPLAQAGIQIQVFEHSEQAFAQEYDAVMLHIMFNWYYQEIFDAPSVMAVLSGLARYRAKYPRCAHIVLHHWDMVDLSGLATPYWRPGDPVLYRTPFYDRRRLYPYPAEDIWAYELNWGGPVYESEQPVRYNAGFIGTETNGRRPSVAIETAKVGIGVCTPEPSVPWAEHNELMAQCRIIVCPRGWGQQSVRHWDAWWSGKPVLTDRECDQVELIPGARLREGEHYLVYDQPEQIPDIVTDWTRPSRAAELAQIAANGHAAVAAHDGAARMLKFFNHIRERNRSPNTHARAPIA